MSILSEEEILGIFATCHKGRLYPQDMVQGPKMKRLREAEALEAAILGKLAEHPIQRGEVPIAPANCPITGRRFWGNMSHPERGMVALYGGPYDSYTIPSVGEDGELRCERYDQDEGAWVEGGEPVAWIANDQSAGNAVANPFA